MWGWVHTVGNCVCSGGPLLLWDQYTEGMGKEAVVGVPREGLVGQGSGGDKGEQETEGELLAKYPWLATHMQKDSGQQAGLSKGDMGNGEADSEAPDSSEGELLGEGNYHLPDEEVDQVFEELHRKRAEWAVLHKPPGDDFRLSWVVSGLWSILGRPTTTSWPRPAPRGVMPSAAGMV